MKYRKQIGVAFAGAVIVAACGTDEGTVGGLDDSTQYADDLVESSTLAPGASCESGGTLVQVGPDENGNGSLDADEIRDSYNVCNGAAAAGTNGASGPSGNDGANGNPGPDGENGVQGPSGVAGPSGIPVLSSTTPASLTACPDGGVVVQSGADDNENSTLDSAEIDEEITICSGSPGADACPAVVRVTPIAAGSTCSLGGIEIASGPDTGLASGAGGAGGAPAMAACDGVLTLGEEQSSEIICNGTNGQPGSDGVDGNQGPDGTAGNDQLIKVTTIAAGGACAAGGFLVERGLDDGPVNGVLDAGEVDYTETLCTPDDPDDDGVDNDSDNCIGVANPAQIDQDGDGIGDVCDPTPCTGNSCEANCTDLVAQGSTVSGYYAIDPTGTGPFPAYCDMTTDGGGWTLVLNYAHEGGTNPPLDVRSTDLPLVHPNTTIGDDESGTVYWGHADTALFTALDVDETRFWAASGQHARVIHFKTDECNDRFEGNDLDCNAIDTNHTDLPGHTATLPDGATWSIGDDTDLGAMTNFPYYITAQRHWGISGYGNRWEVDDYDTSGNSLFTTWHQIYVRSNLSIDERDCRDHLIAGRTSDGYYYIDPDGPGVGVEPFQAYCDMTTDGGGWTRCAQIDETGLSNQLCVDEGDAYLDASSLLNNSFCQYFYENYGADNFMMHNLTAGETSVFDDRVVVDWTNDPIVAVGDYSNAESVTCTHINGGDGVATDLPNCRYASHGGGPWQSAAWSFTQNDLANGYSGNYDSRVLLGPTFDCATGAGWYYSFAGQFLASDAGWNGLTQAGDVYLRKNLPVPVCDLRTENQTVSLTCPAGKVITTIHFASYGTPTGSCGGGDLAQSSCHSSQSLGDVEALCLGNNSCNVPATNGQFGDPCVGTVKRLAVSADCE